MSSRMKPLVLVAFVLAVTVFGPGEQQRVSAQTTVPADQRVVDDLMRRVEFLENELQRVQQQPSVPAPAFGLVSEHYAASEEGDACNSCQCGGTACGTGCCSCGTCRCHGFYSCQCPLQPAPCIECPRVSTVSPFSNLHLFGALKLDMIFSEPRPFSPGTPFFLAPSPVPGNNQNIVSIHARQSTIGAAYTGPKFCGLQAGGTIIAMLFNDNVVADRYGLLPLQAFGELKNDDWRFAAGLQFDVFSPGLPTVLPFSALAASGNAGNSFRGQVRLERFLHVNARKQWTLQAALSEPINSTIDPTFRISEDNGWPNVEGRVALGLGCVEGVGPAAKRPFEVGVSGVVGQLRTTDLADTQVVADVWGLSSDFRWKMTDRLGFLGEVYTGESLGTYNGGILQTINADTLAGIRSTGGWMETFYYWTPCLHSHTGFGIDDPIDNDISSAAAALGRTYNSTIYSNLLWDLNNAFRIGFEFTWRQTNYTVLADNEGPGFHTQFQWLF